MKKLKAFYSIILSILLLGTIGTTLLTLTNVENNNNSSSQIDDHSSNLYSSQDFELIVEFEPSAYFISPGSSPGQNDGVFFTFMANKNGNYTLDVNNFPNALTQSVPGEYYVAFDNPSGTDLYYLSFMEFDRDFLGEVKIKVFKSENCGKSWKMETVATIPIQGENLFDLFYYVKGTAIAAYPSIGLIGIVSIINNSELVYFHSTDNGTTWQTPITIAKTQVDNVQLPNIEIAILKNGTIYVLYENTNPNYTDIVYFESHNNGTMF